MPRITGPWLAGTFDSDRAVARAASDALSQVFATPEKIHGVSKTFQQPILEYCRDAILRETVGTLSDERNVSPEDAHATYTRVVATAISVLNDLISGLQPGEREREHDLYIEILKDTKLWNFAGDSDAAVKRSLYQLTRTLLEHKQSIIKDQLNIVSTALIYKGLQADQSTCALEYVQTLRNLTTVFPTIWTDAYTGKKPVVTRLKHFLKQGSQSSPTDYWQVLKDFFPKLPQQMLPQTTEEAADLLGAARTGVCKREERSKAASAWPAYFVLVDVITSSMTSDVRDVLEQTAMPAITQFVLPTSEFEAWAISGARSAATISNIISIMTIVPVIERRWPKLGLEIVELAKASQPEQSKEFDKSQLQVAATGERFAILQQALWQDSQDDSKLSATFVATSTQLLEDCMALVKSRNGKPYGAAAIVEQLLRQSGQELLASDTIFSSYRTFAIDDLPNFIFSPSQRQLINGLYAATSAEFFSSAFEKVLQRVLSSSESTDNLQAALRSIFSSATPQEAIDIARRNEDFQKFIATELMKDQRTPSSTLLVDLIRMKVANSTAIDSVLSSLIKSLDVEDRSESSLSTIDQLSQTSEKALREVIERSSDIGDQLLPNLLRLEQSPDEATSVKATSLVARLSSAIGDSAPDGKFSIVLQNLEKVSGTSLSISAVLDLTRRLLGPEPEIVKADEMLPDLTVWRTALDQTMEPPRPSLALLSPFGGTVHLLKSEDFQATGKTSYDSEGYSQALRIAAFISMLITKFNLMSVLGEQQADVAALLHVTMQVAEDNLSIAGANGLWKAGNAGSIEPTVLDLMAEVNQGIAGYLDSWSTIVADEPEQSRSFFAALKRLSSGHASPSPAAFYAALSSAKVGSNLAETHGVSNKDSTKAEEILKAQRSSHELIPQMSTLVGLQQALANTVSLTRYCNELVADLTDFDLPGKEIEGLQKLVLLNCILRTQEDAAASIAKQRLIFLVKRLIPWLGTGLLPTTKAEVCKVLTELLPSMADIYGEHWEQTLDFLSTYWNSSLEQPESGEIDEGQLVLQHASLRLLDRLNRLSKMDEPNDDLVDAMKDKRDSLRDGLINLLKLADGKSDEMHQPLMITNELLARQLAAMPFSPRKVLEDLYPLMFTPSRPIQQATFDLLHQQIPAAQEQISLDAALDRDSRAVQLPDELLSLILEAPTLESLVDESFERSMPRSLQGYLFSWRLIFDHFSGSSYKVKGDYIEQLKDGRYIPDLLSFTFDFLGHSLGKPIDASKFDVQNYVSDSEPSPEKDVQWLLAHLYYLALTHLPSLAKSYYLDIRSRQTSLAVESWTAKYFSPLITSTALKDVAEWSEKSLKDDPEFENMTVRVGMKSKEINVSYLIDEQTMAIKVVLPEAYPLAPAQVQGVNRVAVKEEKWQSWLRNCQGVITFSVSANNSSTITTN